MKKFIYSLLLLVLSMAMLISCEESVGDNTDGSAQLTDPVPALPVETPEEQKIVLEQTALAFIEEVAAENFEEVANLLEYMLKEYSDDNYNYDEVEDWSEGCYNALIRVFEKTEIQKGSNDLSYKSIDIIDYYSVVCAASNYTGKFEAKNGQWKYTDANDLSFHVKDAQGKPCVLRLTTGGKTKNVYVESYWYYVGGSYENGVESNYYNVDKCYLQVPEVITVTLQHDGDDIAKVMMKADLSLMQGTEIDLRKDKYNLMTTVEFNNYSIIDNIKYAPEKGTSVTRNFKKGNKSLFSVKASADLDVSNENFYGSEKNNVEIDVMGCVQFKGNMAGDIVEAYEELEKVFDAENEAQLMGQLDKVNSLMDLSLYYYKSPIASAKFELRAFKNEPNDGYWHLEPVIVFEDETSYSIDTYFNEDDFKKVIRGIERLGEDYSDLLDKIAD